MFDWPERKEKFTLFSYHNGSLPAAALGDLFGLFLRLTCRLASLQFRPAYACVKLRLYQVITALVLLQAEASAIVAERQAERRASRERSASHDTEARSTRSIGGTLSSETFTPSRAAAPRVSHCAASGGLALADNKKQITAPVQPCNHVQD